MGNDDPPQPAISSPGGTPENSPGRKSGVNEKKENNSTLPKAAAVDRSSEATDTHRRENITDWALEQFRAPTTTTPRIPFANPTACHPEAAESSAKRATPNEGPMQLAGSPLLPTNP